MIGSETECYGYALSMYPPESDQHCNGAAYYLVQGEKRLGEFGTAQLPQIQKLDSILLPGKNHFPMASGLPFGRSSRVITVPPVGLSRYAGAVKTVAMIWLRSALKICTTLRVDAPSANLKTYSPAARTLPPGTSTVRSHAQLFPDSLHLP